MTLSLRLDLNNATVADLEALLAAARAGGIGKHSAVTLHDNHLEITATNPTATPTQTQPEQPPASHNQPQLGPVGESALRTVVDLLAKGNHRE
ncbi:hypothetical protein G7Y31_08290 [Corynebacterium lizhenjunii]|uniref:Uncharacterized protein n=1 Tax=Corynebacterium lizhenjunii TaxID=2709394 RepID=A0A7T0PBB4_9CORY|nr:hypothetical protein [Corynebacterium lizhenjunii]QPK78552.1 hypothetical protein G7Y31_08290 [Corynebacterium lizhenjunii]